MFLPLLLTLIALDSIFVPVHCHGISLDAGNAIWLAGDSGVYRIIDYEPQRIIDKPTEAVTISNIAPGDVFLISNTHHSRADIERYSPTGELITSDSIRLHMLERPPGIPLFSGFCSDGNDRWVYFNAGPWFETGCWRIDENGDVSDRWSPVEIAPLAVQGLLWDDSLFWVGERNWSRIYAYASSGGFYRSSLDEATLAAPPLVGLAGHIDDFWAAFLRPGGTRLIRYQLSTAADLPVQPMPAVELEVYPTLIEKGGSIRFSHPTGFTLYNILGREVCSSYEKQTHVSLSLPAGVYFFVSTLPSIQGAIKIIVVE